MIVKSITEHIGNTPLLLIDEEVHGFNWVEIYAKLEYLNPFGSVKDRTALGILKESENKDIIESSSGNTAKALGILANLSGKDFLTVTNRIKQKEVEDILRIIWVDIQSLPPGSECPDPHDPNSPFWVIQRIMSENPWKYYWTDQYTNTENPQIHHDTTAQEIDGDIGTPDFLFSGLGTTWSSRGIIEYFHERWWGMQSIGIISAGGSYIPGIRNSHEMGEVWLFMSKYYANIIPVNDHDGVDSMLTLIRRCGMLVWPTTWAVYHGMIEYLRSLDPSVLKWKKVVFIACDRVEPYTSYIREKRPTLFESKKKIEKPKILWALQTIKKEDLQKEKYILIDMRSYPSYELGHIDWSISFSFYKIQEYLKDEYLPFPRESPLVFICPFWEESSLMCQIANWIWYDSYSLEGGYSPL
jgi:cysteine synthase/rhodanese-related sulfurtransferase